MVGCSFPLAGQIGAVSMPLGTSGHPQWHCHICFLACPRWLVPGPGPGGHQAPEEKLLVLVRSSTFCSRMVHHYAVTNALLSS